MSPDLGDEAQAILAASSRVVLLGTRADGSPTGWPMVGLLAGDVVEFSTYAKSAKVAAFRLRPGAAVVALPDDGPAALALAGAVEVRDHQHEPSPEARAALDPTRVVDGIASGARARMAAGKRIVLAFRTTRSRIVVDPVDRP